MRPLRRNRRSGGLSTCWPHPSESANRRWSWFDVGKAQHVSTRICPETRGRQLTEAAAIGAAAGLVGFAAMTLAEQAEQKITGRPDSFVPARALLTLLGRRPAPSEQPVMWHPVTALGHRSPTRSERFLRSSPWDRHVGPYVWGQPHLGIDG